MRVVIPLFLVVILLAFASLPSALALEETAQAGSLSLIADALVRILMSPVSCTLRLCLTVPCSMVLKYYPALSSVLQALTFCLMCCPCCWVLCPFSMQCEDLYHSLFDVACGDACRSASGGFSDMVAPLTDIMTGSVEKVVYGLLRLPVPAAH